MTTPFSPVWQTPAAPGMLSNRRGSDFAADAISCLARYRHPLGATADSPSALQVKAYRTVSKGTPQAAELVWDSGVQGGFGFSAPAGLPAPVNSGPGGVPSYPVCQVNTRVYATFGTYRVYSAPIAGSGLGAWRMEIDLKGLPTFVNPPIQIMQVQPYGIGTPQVMTLHVFSAGSTGLVHNRLAIAADGTLSVVAAIDPVLIGTVATFQQVALGWGEANDISGTGLWQPQALLCGAVWGLQAASNVTHLITFDGTGAITAISAAGPVLPAALRGVVVQGGGVSGAAYTVIGGDTGAASVSTIYSVTITTTAGPPATTTLNAWATAGTGIPVGRARAGFAVGWGGTFCWYILGGQLTGATQATVYYINYANIGTGAWSTGTALPSATQDVGAISLGVYPSTALGVFGGTFSQITSMGSTINTGTGADGAWNVGSAPAMTAATVGGAKRTVADGVLNSTTTVTSATAAFVADDVGRPIFGAGIPFGATILTITSGTSVVGSMAATATGSGVSITIGSGGTFVVNPDGSADIGFVYGGFGAGNAVTAALQDGDQIQLSITFWERAVGDGSPTTMTIIKIGQPPTLTSIVPANASTVISGRPVASFMVNPGVGGAQEKSYRIRVTQGGGTPFDTGVLYDGANAATVRPSLGQSLANLAYSLILDVISLDVPMPGSSSSITSTTTFNGPTTAAPSVPTSLTVTPNPTSGWTLLSWVDQVDNTGFARIYKKAAGAINWGLYRDNQVSTGIGVAHTFQAMEEIAFGVAYDYAVSTVNATGVESALTTILDSAGNSQLIPPKQPSDTRYSIMLHVVGNGPAQKVGLQIVVIGSRGHAVTVVTEQDAQPVVGFGNKAPTIRTGIYSYRRIDVKPIFQGPAALAAIEAIMIAAMAGSTICYRDTLGTIIYCGPATARTRREGHAHEDDLSLIETSFIYAP